ncbi:hypothetical protein [Novosphingobium sp. FKTRR1]|uniref:hypothetical protein n=1 Tax=Novosphingobium sp. FKTRR1 TaxID=2879118 RepID=UPI001CEFF5A4|nr:hypothetical protein [Novosphingobium sp. FKTRR1]
MSDTPLTFQDVADEFRRMGLHIEAIPGEYVLSYRGRTDCPTLRVEDLAEALTTGRQMAENPPPDALPPLGPTGRRHSRRGKMMKHNRWVAARRRALTLKRIGKP